nr:DUF559 domain-containing protein [uncultured Sphingomonas sp.]
MFILAVIIGAFILYHFLPERIEEPEKADPKPRYVAVRETDTDWRSEFHANTESPAEIAFIDAMIDAFDLRPNYGALFSTNLRLDLQVEQGRFRTDFMVNRWLVVEIDGAAWHSSAEARSRDASRDQYFESLGYTVLRIPARVALYDAAETIRRVRAAVAIGKRSMPDAVRPARRSGLQRMAQTGSSIMQAIDNVNEYTRQARIVDPALLPAQSTFDRERKIIESALFNAREKRIEKDAGGCSNVDYRTRQQLDLERLINKYEYPSNFGYESPRFPEAPSASGEYADVIARRYQGICELREEFFERTRRKLSGNNVLKEDTLTILRGMNHNELARLIA